MKSRFLQFFLLLTCVSLAHAHFTFVVPEPDGTKAKMIMSETLTPEAGVDVAIIGGTKLYVRTVDGSDTPLTLVKEANAYEVSLAGAGTRVVHGFTDLGIMQRGSGKPHVLLYYPKTILGDAFDPKTVVGGETPVEIVPIGKPGDLKLKLVGRGKPVPHAEITVILPDATQKVVKTDESGLTETFSQTGRFGAWARFWESVPGERNGKKYEELRHYATLVFDAAAASVFATMPEAASSFGAVESDGWLYVYGGHIAATHSYSTESVSDRFSRLNLASRQWEDLPPGPGLQGMNLTAHNGRIYRIGGMAPRNKPGEPADNHSTSECARYDPATKKWEALPPLPQARSSHDVVVIGNQMIVTGGWTLAGSRQEWADTLVTMNLSEQELEWKSAAQPFRRRALIAAVLQEKLYVIGGINDKDQIEPKVSIYDPKAGTWSEGPALPEGVMAFAPAATIHDGSLYVSVFDGTLFRLDGSRWEKAGKATGRVAHRLVSYKDGILVIGGAARRKNFDLIEPVSIQRSVE